MVFKVAVITESECIGCTKCLQFCPFDAIIGANKQIHTILESACTGCELCVEPCPVDCISIIEGPEMLYNSNKVKIRRQLNRERTQHAFAATSTDTENNKKNILDILNRGKTNG
jgi:electron transport complex protein RnfB